MQESLSCCREFSWLKRNSHLFSTVDESLLLWRDPFFLLHPFFYALHLHFGQKKTPSESHRERDSACQCVVLFQHKSYFTLSVGSMSISISFPVRVWNNVNTMSTSTPALRKVLWQPHMMSATQPKHQNEAGFTESNCPLSQFWPLLWKGATVGCPGWCFKVQHRWYACLCELVKYWGKTVFIHWS